MMAKVGRGRRARWLVLSSSSSAGPLVHVQHTNAAHSVDGVKIVVSFRFGPARGERMRGRTPLRYVIISSLRTAEAGGGQGPAWRDGGVSGRRSGQRAAGNGQRATGSVRTPAGASPRYQRAVLAYITLQEEVLFLFWASLKRSAFVLGSYIKRCQQKKRWRLTGARGLLLLPPRAAPQSSRGTVVSPDESTAPH